MINSNAHIREQEALIEALDAALRATGMLARPEPGPWLSRLTPQQRSLIGALYGAYPKCLNKEQLIEILPARNGRENLDRQSNLVMVQITRVRGIFGGRNVIENRWSVGYRLSDEFYASIPKHELTSAEPSPQP